MTDTVKHKICHRITKAVLFECEVTASLSGPRKIGMAVKLAIEANANLAEANLADANLARANLARAYLGGAYLAHAYLAHANLAGANLAEANLARANLAEANLAGANLERANLAEANLAGANLAGAEFIIALGSPNGWHAHAWIRDGILSIRVGCREFRLSEARAYWTGKEDRREVIAALDYAETVAKIRGWTIEETIAEAAQ